MKKDFGMGFVSSFKCPELVDFFKKIMCFSQPYSLVSISLSTKSQKKKMKKKNLLFIESYFSFLEFFILMGTAV